MIIGFAGKAASGKTTAARYLAQQLGETISVLPMAAMLRREIEDFLQQVGATDKTALLYGDQQDKLTEFVVDESRAQRACPQWHEFVRENNQLQQQPGLTVVNVRRILQWWGTEYRRHQDPDYWTKAWEQAFRKLGSVTDHVLVDDVRFINEVEVIRCNGGVLVRVERPGYHGANDHSSENSLDDFTDWDLVLCNDGNLEQFLTKVDTQVLPLLQR